MKFTKGEKVYYPGRGPCLVGAVVQKVVCGVSSRFYRLAVLDDRSAEVFVPVDGAGKLRIRALLAPSEIPRLLGHLKPKTEVIRDRGAAKNWRQRELESIELFRSGSLCDLADAVESLTRLRTAKTLALHERDTLYRARRLLICEISEVLGESKAAAESRIDRALEVVESAACPSSG